MAGGGATTSAAGGGTDWSKILGALGGGGDSKDGKSGQVMPLPAIQNAQAGQSQSQIGTPRSAVSLDQLIKMLTDRANLYQQAAMGAGAGPVPQQTRPPGLLGF